MQRKFYFLSSIHHPDHNPNDPQASDRFVKISEAYGVLGVPEKRERYDRETGGSSRHAPLHQSSSSSSTPFGSRPASGLSRRRTQFRGPPPSFFRNGGWGSQGAKRTSGASFAADATARARTDPDQCARPQGTSAAEDRFGTKSFDDVPHFDREVHLRFHERQDQRRERRERRAQTSISHRERDGNMLLNFLLVSGIVIFAFSFNPTLGQRRSLTRDNERTNFS